MINFILILQSRVATINIEIQLWHVAIFSLLVLIFLAWGIWDVRKPFDGEISND